MAKTYIIKHEDLYLYLDPFTSWAWAKGVENAGIFFDYKGVLDMQVLASRWLKVPLDEIEIVEGES